MKRLVILLLLVLAPLPYAAAQGSDADAIRAELLAFSGKVTSVTCDFVQRRESALLAEPVLSSGQMRYRRPGCLEWRYLEPFDLSFTADAGAVSIRRNGREEPLSGPQGRLAREMTQLIIRSVEGSVLSDEKLFRSEFAREGGEIVVLLYPLRKEMQKMWSSLVLRHDGGNMGARSIEMRESSGDTTLITFNKVRYGFSE